MGHDSERAAMISQHDARGADQTITSAIDSHVQAEQRGDEVGDGQAGALAPWADDANGTVMDRVGLGDIEREIDAEARERFPGDAVRQVVLLQYGDDPEIEPGDLWVRVLLAADGPRGLRAVGAGVPT